MPLSVGTRLGPYEILAPLGAGGMGEVYRARDTRLSREVAIKVLPAELAADSARLKRFEKEARSASALNHPNIVTIYDIGCEGGISYIAMERVEGPTLREIMAGGLLPMRRLLQIAPQIAEGLSKAHDAGIVHRDLKPENVMVTRDGLVKILDFGLAKLTSTLSGSDAGSHLPTMTGTTPGVVVGTVGYMSPEQASGEPLDFRSDQFSLGSILYEMATGRRAFQKKTAIDTLAAILNEEPEAIARVNPQAPAPLRWIVERCLAKEPENRYASTKDLARDLASLRDRISEVTSGAEALLGSRGRPRRPIARLVAGAALAAGLTAAGWAAARASSSGPPPAPSFRRLTFRQGLIGFGRFAPDGRTVVYSANPKTDFKNPQWDLVQTIVGSPESRAFDFRGYILAISSSNELAILQGATLARVPLAGGTPRQVLDNSTEQADFSPDGRELAISRDVDGKSQVEFPPGKVLVSDAHSPRFSPDGKTIAFCDHTSTEGPSLGLVDRLGKSKKSLTPIYGGLSGAPCWRPDGREIWFTASGLGERGEALWAVDLSGRRRLLLRVPGNMELYDISKDGKALLAYQTMTRTVRGASSADSRERDLSWLDQSVAADISADGKTLLFTEDGEGSGGEPTVYVRGMDGSPAVRLGKGTARALSPDGKWVLALTDRLLLLPTGPGEERPLDASGLADFRAAGWLPDSRTVVFSAAPAGGASRIWVQAVPDGKPRPISPGGFRVPLGSNPVSPDGRFVVGIRGALRGDAVLLFPLDGAGQPRTVPGLDPRELWVHQWTSDMRALYVSNYSNEWPPAKVWLLDLQTGQRRLWKQIDAEQPPIEPQNIRVTPDGSAWVYSAGHSFSALYVVEGLR